MAKVALFLLVPLIALAAFMVAVPDNQEGLPNWTLFSGVVHLTSVLDKIKETFAPPSNKIFELTTAYWKSSIIRTLATLRVADTFRTSNQKQMTCPEIIDQLGRLNPPINEIHPPFFCRLLRAAAAEGLLSVDSKYASLGHLLGKEKDVPTPRFSLTELGALLDSEDPKGSYNLVMGLSGNFMTAWSVMDKSIQTGRSGFLQAFDDEIWDYGVNRDPTELKYFNQAMREFSLEIARVARADYNFSSCSHICDIGGGVGTIAVELIKDNPQAKATILDISFLEKDALQFFKEKGVEDRAKFVVGSFFNRNDIPKECDCYITKHIVHDWPDKDIKQILSNIAYALSPTDRVILIESVIGSSNLEAIETVKAYMDLCMLAVCPSGALERTALEFKKLFLSVGLEVASIRDTRSFMSLVEGRLRH